MGEGINRRLVKIRSCGFPVSLFLLPASAPEIAQPIYRLLQRFGDAAIKQLQRPFRLFLIRQLLGGKNLLQSQHCTKIRGVVLFPAANQKRVRQISCQQFFHFFLLSARSLALRAALFSTAACAMGAEGCVLRGTGFL